MYFQNTFNIRGNSNSSFCPQQATGKPLGKIVVASTAKNQREYTTFTLTTKSYCDHSTETTVSTAITWYISYAVKFSSNS